MIIQTFFVNAVSGSVISQISAMVDNPTMIISLVSYELASQSYIAWNRFFSHGGERMNRHSRVRTRTVSASLTLLTYERNIIMYVLYFSLLYL
jgi:hypothetical protein